jgi:hypothetical protein
VDSGDIKKGAVKTADIAKNAIRGANVGDGLLSGADVKDEFGFLPRRLPGRRRRLRIPARELGLSGPVAGDRI